MTNSSPWKIDGPFIEIDGLPNLKSMWFSNIFHGYVSHSQMVDHIKYISEMMWDAHVLTVNIMLGTLHLKGFGSNQHGVCWSAEVILHFDRCVRATNETMSPDGVTCDQIVNGLMNVDLLFAIFV